MLFRLYKIKGDKKNKSYYTSYPNIDLHFWGKRQRHIEWLSNPTPLGRVAAFDKPTDKLYYYIKKIFGLESPKKDIEIPVITENARSVPCFTKDKILEILQGRILFPEEVQRALKENALTVDKDSSIYEILHQLYLEESIEIIPALVNNHGKYKCMRCGEQERILQVKCATCGDENCVYCDSCVSMGQARSCGMLIAKSGVDIQEPKEVMLELEFELNQSQKDVYKSVENFIQGAQPLGLVWAACGAGKTEVSFGAIKRVLESGKKVLFAIPRKDVVAELEPRLRKAFPESKILALYGGSGRKYSQADIVIATTHQCLRFYRNFSLVILDEADAFPYEGSEMLYLAIERARASGGKLLYMTATPTDSMLELARKGKIATFTLPVRHHGYPLPVPTLFLDTRHFYSKNNEQFSLPKTAINYISDSIERDKAQVFVFVPSIDLADKVFDYLTECFKENANLKIASSHSRDTCRDEKRELFSKGKIHVFITTSIMERGITVDRANVLVLFANFERIYSWRALLQMAGRSGRKKEYPLGKVMFMASSKSTSMEKAVNAVKAMNKEAWEKGYIKYTWGG